MTGCDETRIPRDPELRIAQDSVYLDLDPSVTYQNASTCTLPPWPEEEDTTATAKEQNFFRDSSDSRPRQIDMLPPGWGARTGRTPPGEE